jgi:glutamyl-tRNA reductase
LSKLPDLLPEVDIVVSCTGSESPIITRRMMDDVIAENTQRFGPDRNRLIIMDLAIPRDVEFDRSYHTAVEVLNLEDVNDYVGDQRSRMRAEEPKAEEIIDRRLDEFIYWFDHVRHEPIYNGLGDAFENVRSREMSQLLKILPSELRDEVDKTTRRMVNKLLQIKVRPSGE